VNLNDLIDVNKDFSETLKSKYNCNGSRIIGYVGRIEELKGINVLLRAFSEVIAYSKNVKLVIVGSGHIEKAKELAIELEIADHVNFTGFYDGNIYDVLNSFDIFVFPSLWEGLPYAILEAMLLKKIIISTNVGGIPEVIENEVNGILVDPSNYSQLSSAIIRVLSNFNEYEKLGIQAYEKVTSRLSLKDFAEKINYLIDAQTR
jgi:glycosyltransferase involved in cell wall biosynthesis